jgi:hypothetical protein
MLRTALRLRSLRRHGCGLDRFQGSGRAVPDGRPSEIGALGMKWRRVEKGRLFLKNERE